MKEKLKQADIKSSYPFVFKKTAIVGLGLIGGSLGLALKRKFPDLYISGVGRQVVIDEAIAIGAIDQGFLKTEVEKCVAEADLVILCMPIKTIINMLPIIAKSIKAGTLVTDVGSTKRQIVETANKIFPEDRYFLGGHPMAGTEHRGIHSSDALLFENAVYVLTPTANIPRHLVLSFKTMVEAIGARILLLDPDQHDHAAAAVSHLPQLTAISLMNLIRRQKDAELLLQLAAGGFRDMTRIASSPYDIWEDIIQTNKKEIVEFIDHMINTLKNTKEKLIKDQLSGEFKHASDSRASIPKDTKGFLRPHYDLALNVEDKPGIIATIANTLANENINIKDIEVLKVREGDHGTIRISMETTEARESAFKLLGDAGIAVKII
jgi:prephenate dehydrogenase